jgi:PHD/YefM family antitoxin component YafN of YafNO toxin-antitoxin module
MDTATIRIPEEKKNLLKAAASLENRKMNDVVIELIDEYIESHKETLELLAIPGFLRKIRAAQQEFREGKGVSIEDVRKELEHRSRKSRPEVSKKNGNRRLRKDPRPPATAGGARKSPQA